MILNIKLSKNPPGFPKEIPKKKMTQFEQKVEQTCKKGGANLQKRWSKPAGLRRGPDKASRRLF